MEKAVIELSLYVKIAVTKNDHRNLANIWNHGCINYTQFWRSNTGRLFLRIGKWNTCGINRNTGIMEILFIFNCILLGGKC